MNLGEQLVYAQRNKVMTRQATEFKGCHFAYDSVAVVSGCGRFALQVYDHDTGMSVRGYIIGAGEPYLFINGTHWKRPGYDHNPYLHESGAWDADFSQFRHELNVAIFDHKHKMSLSKEELERERERIAEERKAAVSSLFG